MWSGPRPEQAGRRLEHQALQPDSMGLHPPSFCEPTLASQLQPPLLCQEADHSSRLLCVLKTQLSGVGVWTGDSAATWLPLRGLCLQAAAHEEGRQWVKAEHSQIVQNKNKVTRSVHW